MNLTVEFAAATLSKLENGYAYLIRDDDNSQYVILPISAIKFQKRPAREEDFTGNTRVLLAPKSSPVSGEILLYYEPTSNLSLSLEWRFPKYRKLPVSDIYLHLFFGFLELSVITAHLKLLNEALARLKKQPNGEQSYLYLINFIEYISKVQTVASADMLGDRISMDSYAGRIKGELETLMSRFFVDRGEEWVYVKAKEKEIQTEDWNLHAFASFFNVVLIEVKSSQNQIEFTYHYPNSLTPFLYPIYFTLASSSPVLLYPFESLSLRNSPGKFTEFLLKPNHFARLLDVHAFRNSLSESTLIQPLCQLYEFITLESSESLSNSELVIESQQEKRTPGCPSGMQLIFTMDPLTLSGESAIAELKDMKTILARVYCCVCQQAAKHSFPCGCGICETCVLTQLQKTKKVYCMNHQHIVMIDQLSPALNSTLLAKVEATFDTLTCEVCHLEADSKAFPVRKKFKPLVYVLDCGDYVCTRCLEKAARTKVNQCPVCGLLVDLHERELAEMEETCTKCDQRKSIENHYLSVRCADHRFCTECLSHMVKVAECEKCKRIYDESERKALESVLKLQCLECNKVVTVKNVWPQASDCNCVICRDCGVTLQLRTANIGSCLKCGKGEYTAQQMTGFYNNMVLMGVGEAEQAVAATEMKEFEKFNAERLKKFACLICQEPIPLIIDRFTSGPRCPHLFHRGCLEDALVAQIDDIRGRDLKRRLRCPTGKCPVEVDERLIVGEFAVLQMQSYEKYIDYFIKLTDIEFVCKGCKCVGFIDIELNHFQCQCGYHQCLTCKGKWSETHNEKECRFYTIENLYLAMAELPCEKCEGKGCDNCMVGQCPGCKYPYLKDEHCDHVKCTRPECAVEFCFKCSCLRKPTLEHCNQWHRKQCQWYPKETEKTTKKIVDGEKSKPACPECVRLGKRCNPPKDLKSPRRFTLEEFLE